MSRILVIEPSQMLRHAFAIALSPEYQVETLADFPDKTQLEKADLVVVNAATLKGCGKLSGNDLATVRTWEKAVIWINAEQNAEPGESSTVVGLPWPIDKDGLQKAITSCLQKIPETSREGLKPKKVTPPGLKTVQRSEALSGSTELGAKRLIELVDIVE